MAKHLDLISSAFFEKVTKRGRYSDGGGLYLVVSPGGSKSWAFFYKINNRRRHMGLGALSLRQARARAAELRDQRASGGDPLEMRRAVEAAQRLEDSKRMTFRQAAAAYIAAHRPGWKSGKHSAQWENTLTSYAYPHFGDRPIASIDTPLVLTALTPIWHTKRVTARRLRARIEMVIDWATASGHRSSEIANPARWKGHMALLLPKGRKHAVGHHESMAYSAVPAFMADLRKREGIPARAMELTILTALRTSEIILARWSEIDWDDKCWTIPAERRKNDLEHQVPLSPQALELLRQLRRMRGDDGENDGWIFPGRKRGKPITNMAMLALLQKRMKRNATVHGFRSSFRTWGSERTAFKEAVLEYALGHAEGDQVIAAYRRTTFFDLRRKLMQAWASYITSPAKAGGGEVVPIRAA